MRVCWKIFSLGLVTAIAYSALLSGQDRPSSKQIEGRAATFDSAKSQNAASAPAGTSESSSITPPLPFQDSSQAESMFDTLGAPITGPVTQVEVHARVGDSEIGEPFRTGGKEILSTAGSFGDIERFLQVLPGVVMLFAGAIPWRTSFSLTVSKFRISITWQFWGRRGDLAR